MAARRALGIAVAIILLTGVVNVWLYVDGKRTLHQEETTQGVRSEMVNRMDGSLLRVVAVAFVAGFGSLACLMVASKMWRVQFLTTLNQKEDQWKADLGTVQNQVNDARRARDQSQMMQARLEEKLQTLTTLNQGLQEKLDKRDRAERVFTAKRQELETSKSVLELHVQARTQELQKLQRRYEMILNSAGEGICGFDIDGKLTFANPTVTRVTGWQPEELAGKTEPEIFWGDKGGERVSPNGENDYGEQILHRKDGSCFTVEFVRTPINENNRVVGSVLVFKDITERKQVEEALSHKASELARSNAELEQFAFVASHDLQEPLRKIQAFGDRLKMKCDGGLPEEAQDYLQRMQNASARMRNLIDDLLAFSRVIRRSEPFVPVALGEVVREVLSDLEVRIEKSRAQLEIGELPTLDADPMQMRQLFLNLFSNALKFQPQGGAPLVKVASRVFTVSSGKQMCEFQVQDNGIGFDEKYVDRIFAVFQRLHGRSEYEGTGVGLAVCRRIVERHGGTIVARSKPGQGATFIVTLPLFQAVPEAISGRGGLPERAVA